MAASRCSPILFPVESFVKDPISNSLIYYFS